MNDGRRNNESHYTPGEHYEVCDICGFVFLSSLLRYNWKRQRVCAEDFEVKHPLYNVRAKKDKIAPPQVRPETTDIFLEPGDATADDL